MCTPSLRTAAEDAGSSGEVSYQQPAHLHKDSASREPVLKSPSQMKSRRVLPGVASHPVGTSLPAEMRQRPEYYHCLRLMQQAADDVGRALCYGRQSLIIVR